MDDAQRVEAALSALKPRIAGHAARAGGRLRTSAAGTDAAGVATLRDRPGRVGASSGAPLGEGGTGGGSDGNFTAALGVPTLDGLGPQGDGAHALHEHVLARDLTWRAAFLAGLLIGLGADAR